MRADAGGDVAALLDDLLAPRADTFATLADFRAAWRAAATPWAAPVDRALVGGARADRLGYAFAAGYAAALERLVPGVRGACLCVTEEGGAHPRAVRTRLSPDGAGFRLDGAKKWATLAGDGDALLVAASVGQEGDRNLLRLVRVPADAPGVRCEGMPPTPFTPEIPHYAVRLDAVAVPADAVLPGDGWTRYVKPFRTVEDAHVSAAAAAFLLRVARANGWPPALPARLTALILAFREVAGAPPDAPSVHVALGGCLAALEAIVAAAEPCWADTDPAVTARWRRDAPLLGVAGKARAARFEAALGRLGS